MEPGQSIDIEMIPVGGGKGGIGKSVVTAALGSLLALRGKKVVFFDADLGGANLHFMLGIRYPERGLSDFLSRRFPSLADVLLETSVPGTSLISGASDILGLANPKYAQKEKIIRALRKLDADYIFLDLGAGTSFNTIDFFAISNHGIIVIDAELTTMENAYGFLKTSVLRKIQRLYPKSREVSEMIGRLANPRDNGGIATVPDLISLLQGKIEDQGSRARQWLNGFRPRLIANRVRSKEDVDVARRFCDIANKYLGVNPLYVGYVAEDPVVQRGIKTLTPLVRLEQESPATQCLEAITDNLLALELQAGSS